MDTSLRISDVFTIFEINIRLFPSSHFCCNVLFFIEIKKPSNNILWPESNRETKTLIFKCRNCANNYEQADNFVVFKNEIKVAEPFSFHDVYADPTLPRIQRECKRCHFKEACYFQSASFLPDEPMTLYFVCANPTCGFQVQEEKSQS